MTVIEVISPPGQVVEYTTDIVAATTFLNPRHYLNNGGVAAFVAYECSGVYLSSDF